MIAHAFNSMFNSVFTPSSNRLPPDTTDALSVCGDTNDIVISRDGIVALLLKLDTKKSCRPDEIPNQFLRRYCEWISHFLLKIFSVSLRTGGVPEDWLLARIVPVFKAGNKLLPENYRPISITCGACKMLEHIISKHLVEYIENNNLFYGKQHGFRRRLSTVTQLFEVSHAFGLAIM